MLLREGHSRRGVMLQNAIKGRGGVEKERGCRGLVCAYCIWVPLNPSPKQPPLTLTHCLVQGGHVATVRDSRGDDEMAACGQLGSPGQGAGATGGATRSPPVPPLLPPPERLRPVLAGMAGGSSSEH